MKYREWLQLTRFFSVFTRFERRKNIVNNGKRDENQNQNKKTKHWKKKQANAFTFGQSACQIRLKYLIYSHMHEWKELETSTFVVFRPSKTTVSWLEMLSLECTALLMAPFSVKFSLIKVFFILLYSFVIIRLYFERWGLSSCFLRRVISLLAISCGICN